MKVKERNCIVDDEHGLKKSICVKKRPGVKSVRDAARIGSLSVV